MNPPGRLPRRRFLTRAGAAGLGALLLGSCSSPELAQVQVPAARADESRTRRVVRFANWYAYIDTGKGGHPTLAEFTRQTGIRVDYTELFADADQAISLVGGPLAVGRDPGYDLIVVADWVLAKFVTQGWAAELPPGPLTQAWRLLPRFRDWPIPDLHRYSLPWQGGLTGIGYNAEVTRRPVTGMTDLLTSRDLHGRVSLVSDMRDVMGLMLLDQGSDPAGFSETEFHAALARLRRAVGAGQVRVVTNDYLKPLAKGAVAAGVAWSGDILFGRGVNPALQFTWPAHGGMLWTDNMLIPAVTRVRANAERLMNFYYQPPVAAQLAAFNQFICPAQGARAAMRQADPALASQRYIFPSPALLNSGHTFQLLTTAQDAHYTAEFQAAVGL